MKKTIFNWALFGCILFIAIMIAGAGTGSAPFISYVKSNSMEPLIKVNDAIFIMPAKDYEIGDIVMYRPLALNAEYITHRITDTGEKGYITQGDNSPYTDQESDEPQLTKDRIVGRVLTIRGKPVVLPAVGKLTKSVQGIFGGLTVYISLGLIAAGLILTLTGNEAAAKRRRAKRRYRLRDLYRFICITAVITVAVSIYLGSSIKQVKYLVSYYPSVSGNQVLPDEKGQIEIIVNNDGLVPVWSFVKGIKPFDSNLEPKLIAPLSGRPVTLELLPRNKTGIYYGYVQVYNYPVLLPKNAVARLHALSPGLAIAVEAAVMGLYCWIFFRLISRRPGFYGFIPLKAIKDKISGRRLKRTRAILLGYQGRRSK